MACVASFRSLYTQTKGTRQSSSQDPNRRISLSVLAWTPWRTSRRKSAVEFGTETLANEEYVHWVNRLSYDSLEERTYEMTESNSWEGRTTVQTSTAWSQIAVGKAARPQSLFFNEIWNSQLQFHGINIIIGRVTQLARTLMPRGWHILSTSSFMPCMTVISCGTYLLMV